jgi:hypothetical protein
VSATARELVFDAVNRDWAICAFGVKILQSKNFGKAMQRITLEPGKRGGRPCIRGVRI